LIPVEDKSEVHNVLSPAILKIALIEELLTTSNAAYINLSGVPFEMRDWCEFFSRFDNFR